MAMQVLIVFLRVAAAILLSAAVAILLPFPWMDAIHRWLGLGSLPNTPIVNYLARSTSALYATTGAVYAFASTDILRYLPLIRFNAWIKVAFGVCMLGLDVAVGMPWFWTLIEGPFILVYCGVMLWLIRRVEQQSSDR